LQSVKLAVFGLAFISNIAEESDEVPKAVVISGEFRRLKPFFA